MKKALSLHIGLNTIDPNHYGTDGFLRNPENDARDMAQLAKRAGYNTVSLFSKDATAGNVIKEIEKAAAVLQEGDTFLITYSGHGSSVADLRGDEPDRSDETWCLYDRMVLDDELYRCWSIFRRGVRILAVSDSCHSGTVARLFLNKSRMVEVAAGNVRLLPEVIAREIVSRNKLLYESIKLAMPRDIEQKIEASVLLLAACQDHELAGDGYGSNGTFTEQLLNVWNNGKFSGNHKFFLDAIASRIPPGAGQKPNFFWATVVDSVFENEVPFSGNGKAKVTFQPGNGKVKWEIEIDSERLRDISLDELQYLLSSDVPQVLFEAYRKIQDTKEQIIFKNKRGGEVTVECKASDKGWECKGSATIQF